MRKSCEQPKRKDFRLRSRVSFRGTLDEVSWALQDNSMEEDLARTLVQDVGSRKPGVFGVVLQDSSGGVCILGGIREHRCPRLVGCC